MKVIYNGAGEVIATDSSPIDISKDMTGTLYKIEVTVPAGQVIDSIDVSTTNHLPVFKPIEKTGFEKLEDRVNNSLKLFAIKDKGHDEDIADLKLQFKKIDSFLLINQGGEK